jgi:hypothetical protein
MTLHFRKQLPSQTATAVRTSQESSFSCQCLYDKMIPYNEILMDLLKDTNRMHLRPSWSFVTSEPQHKVYYSHEQGGLVSPWLYKENNKLQDWKNVFTLWVPHTYDFIVLTSLTHPRKIVLVVLQIGKQEEPKTDQHPYILILRSTICTALHPWCRPTWLHNCYTEWLHMDSGTKHNNLCLFLDCTEFRV